MSAHEEHRHGSESQSSWSYRRLSEDAKSQDGQRSSDESQPVDNRNLVLWSFFFIGLVILLPWNILITVTGYWDYKFRNVSRALYESPLQELSIVEYKPHNATTGFEELTQLQKEFQSYLAIAANVPNATFVILHALFGHKFNVKVKLPFAQVGQILVLLVITTMAPMNTDGWQETFLVINLSAIALLNMCTAIFQGAAYSNVGSFPVTYMGYLNVGTGVGGLLPTLVSIIILTMNPNFQMAGFWCFVVAVIMAIICVISTLYTIRTPFYNHYTTRGLPDNTTHLPLLNMSQDVEIYKEVFKKCWKFIIAIFVNFACTLAVFPGVTSLIKPSDPTISTNWTNIYFETVLCFLVFNIGDFLGKTLANCFQWPRTSNRDQWLILSAAIIRIGFIPLFMYCNVAPSNRTTEVIFQSEYYYLFFMIAFSVWGGYIGNISVMFGPKVVGEEHQEVTASFLIAFLVVGCGIGAVISASLVKAL